MFSDVQKTRQFRLNLKFRDSCSELQILIYYSYFREAVFGWVLFLCLTSNTSALSVKVIYIPTVTCLLCFITN